MTLLMTLVIDILITLFKTVFKTLLVPINIKLVVELILVFVDLTQNRCHCAIITTLITCDPSHDHTNPHHTNIMTILTSEYMLGNVAPSNWVTKPK
jgi:hypothetical protein